MDWEGDALDQIDWPLAERILDRVENPADPWASIDWARAEEILNQTGGAPSALGRYYTTMPVDVRRSLRYRCASLVYTLRFQHPEERDDLPNTLASIFDEMLADLFIHNASQKPLVGVAIKHPGLDKPLWLPMSDETKMTGANIIALVMRVLQSNEDFCLDDELEVAFTRVVLPVGEGRSKAGRADFKGWLALKRNGPRGSLIEIKNANAMCLARAIVVALARCRASLSPENENQLTYDAVHRTRQQSRGVQAVKDPQTVSARKLMIETRLPIGEGCGIPEASKLEQTLLARGDSVQLKIFSKENFDCLVYTGKPATDILNLYHHDNHYDVITSVPALLDSTYYCHDCDKPYNNKQDHRCAAICNYCLNKPPCARNEPVLCDSCNITFFSQACFERHKLARCKQFKLCLLCGKCYQTGRRRHVCGASVCRRCRESYTENIHYCYMQPVFDKSKKPSPKRKHNDFLPDEGAHDPDSLEALVLEAEGPREEDIVEKTQTYIFFDFETRQNDEGVKGEHVHKVILACALKCCTFCFENEPQSSCPLCGPERQLNWYGEYSLNEFCAWLFSLKHKNAIALAHNMSAFDGQFLMQYLIKQGVKPEVVPQGPQVVYINAKGVTVKDSYKLVPMALEKVPKSFGQEEMKKGFFPYTFFRGLNYKGAWSEPEFYQRQYMSPGKQAAFDLWHPKQTHKVFDFHKELLSYCESDVQILAQGLMQFRQLFMQRTNGVDPLAVSFTIASACSHVFRRNYLQPDTIGIIPDTGYRSKCRFSAISLKWLKWLAQSQNLDIRHALNGGEVQILPHIFADGLCGQTVYEFQGCAFHGCPECFHNRDRLTPFKKLTMDEAYAHTKARNAKIVSVGYQLVEMWECTLTSQLIKDPLIRNFFDRCEIVEPLCAQDAFFGGRTNATKLYHKSQPGAELQYVDFCSLYPYICKYREFPLGHPQIITENFRPIHEKFYRGLIKCVVLPPKNLYHPVLPHRNSLAKLTFPLCATCANKLSHKCVHTDAERALHGTWATLELYQAIDKGYRILQIHEVWHYTQWVKHNVPGHASGLFTEYIDCFFKIKLEASPYPSWVKTDDDRTKFANDCFAKEGIHLREVKPNPGLRSIAKLCLNSFWGKFGQCNNMHRLTYFTKSAKFFSLLADSTSIVHSIPLITEDIIAAVHSQNENFIESSPITNPVIALYTTAQARLHLYKQLDLLGDRVVYMDTDSLIYMSSSTDYNPPMGQYLGELTNELDEYGPRAYIDEFVSAGPKNYAYIVCDPVTGKKHPICKVKGFTLNAHTAQIINFDRLKRDVEEFVHENHTNITPVTCPKISISGLSDRQIVTKLETKRYRVVYDKRVVQPDFTTLPYGHGLLTT